MSGASQRRITALLMATGMTHLRGRRVYKMPLEEWNSQADPPHARRQHVRVIQSMLSEYTLVLCTLAHQPPSMSQTGRLSDLFLLCQELCIVVH